MSDDAREIPGTLPRVTMSLDLSATSYAAFEEVPGTEANVITSMLPDGRHAPVIDLDVPVTLLPSTTPGHSHLYIDVPMEWRQYLDILIALEAAKVVEEGYLNASATREFGTLRLPWVQKVTEGSE